MALEEALERAWTGVTKTSRFSEPLQPPRSGPALLLNATDAATAEPVVVGNVLVGGSRVQAEVERLGFRLSTATILSARFPYVSPEGRVATTTGSVRLVDGGFADNSGAATLARVLDTLDKVAKDRYCPVVLMVENASEELAANGGPGGGSRPLRCLTRSVNPKPTGSSQISGKWWPSGAECSRTGSGRLATG